MKTVYSVTDARNELAEIINRVAYSGESVVVEKYGKPVVRIVPAVKKVINDAVLKEFAGMWKNKPWVKDIGRRSRNLGNRKVRW